MPLCIAANAHISLSEILIPNNNCADKRHQSVTKYFKLHIFMYYIINIFRNGVENSGTGKSQENTDRLTNSITSKTVTLSSHISPNLYIYCGYYIYTAQ